MQFMSQGFLTLRFCNREQVIYQTDVKKTILKTLQSGKRHMRAWERISQPT